MEVLREKKVTFTKQKNHLFVSFVPHKIAETDLFVRNVGPKTDVQLKFSLPEIFFLHRVRDYSLSNLQTQLREYSCQDLFPVLLMDCGPVG